MPKLLCAGMASLLFYFWSCLPFSTITATVSARSIPPESHRIKTIGEAGVEFEEGSILVMDGLVFPAWEPKAVLRRRESFFYRLKEDGPVTVDRDAFVAVRQGKDRYGSRVGKLLTTTGVWVQEYLVREGLALWSGSAFYPPALARAMQIAEQKAEAEKKGLWRDFRVFDTRNTAMRLPAGRFIIAEGKVQEVYETKKNTYVNFGGNWRTDFTVAISPESRDRFEVRGWKLSLLENKLIRIRGWLRYYNGPFVEVEYPQQVEIRE